MRALSLPLTLFLTGCFGTPTKPDDTADSGLDTHETAETGETAETAETGETADSEETAETDSGPEDRDGDGYAEDVDCDDLDEDRHPGATEICNGEDDDCDGLEDAQDDGLVGGMDGWPDNDGDTWGIVADPQTICSTVFGFATRQGDCNDDAPDVYPGAEELCDARDNDCDGTIDDGLDTTTWWYDADLDGYGGDARTFVACAQPVQHVDNMDDCNDFCDTCHPGGTETCDYLDNDCDGEEDEGLAEGPYYPDEDEDGYGDRELGYMSCEGMPEGAVSQGFDCNDADAAINNDAAEVCDGIDNNCDDAVDEGVTVTWYHDQDGDLLGDPLDTLEACGAPEGYVAVPGDCDDADPEVGACSSLG